MAKVRIVIDKQANVFAEVGGIKGQKCVQVDKFLEALGDVKYQKTASFYEDAQPNDVMITNVQ